MPETKTIPLGDMEIEVELVESLSGGGARVDVQEGDRRWRVDVNSTGNDYDIVTTWRDDQLDDVDDPDWMEDALKMVARAA